jgi:hypothetical protein
MKLTDHLIQAVVLVPGVKAYLVDSALGMLKSYDYYYRSLTHNVTMLYNGQIGGDFIDIMQNLIHGQLSDAYESALADNGIMPGEATEQMRAQVQAFIKSDQGYVESYYRDIIDAAVDEKPIDGLLSRVDLWANRWNEVYNAAQVTITSTYGGKLMWVESDETIDKCNTCIRLDGIVAFASDWEAAGVFPQNAPNQALICGGWNCGCSLVPTDKRRSPNALTRIMDIATAGNVGKSIKYDSNQPRVPAGSDRGGEWVGSGGVNTGGLPKDISETSKKLGINENDIIIGKVPDFPNAIGATNLIGAYDSRDGKIYLDIEQIKSLGIDPNSVLAHEAEHKFYREVFEKVEMAQNDEINKLGESGDPHFEDGIIKVEHLEWLYNKYPSASARRDFNEADISRIKLSNYTERFKTIYSSYRTESMAEVARLKVAGKDVPDIWLKAYNSYRSISK